ncbi:unnamed protein product [Fusarium graminearum]|nr:unnamed protein product [Fusarium graminearum]
MDIPGNELVDLLAKKGAISPPHLNTPPTLGYIKRVTRLKSKEELSRWWQRQRPRSYAHLDLDSTMSPRDEILALIRQELHRLITLESRLLKSDSV